MRVKSIVIRIQSEKGDEMKIGITYDLREDYLAEGYSQEQTAEFDKADTIEALEDVLRGLGFETDRIGHVRSLVNRLASGDRWDLVFNIAEGMRGYGREAQVPALLDAYGIAYTFSDPLVLALTLHKGVTKRVVRDLGLPTPDFAIIETPERVAEIRLQFPLFAKPVAEGTGKGISGASRIFSFEQFQSVCERLLVEFKQPVLVEEFLSGREFTVGIIGNGGRARIIGVMEVIPDDEVEGDIYSYSAKENYEKRVEYRLVSDTMAMQAGETALAIWRGLGCRDGGRMDLRADAHGRPNFMEVNPLAGLHPVHSDLPILAGMAGMTYKELIGEIMHSTLERLMLKGPQ
jgi:D-alanine-D-alanine ligase